MTIPIILQVIPRTKKNGMIKTRHGLIQSEAYRQFEEDCLMLISGDKKIHLDRPCNVQCVYYMPTHGKVDLCNLISATCDVLVKAGVLDDDNSRIVTGHDGSMVLYDKDNPRTEIFIEIKEATDEH